MSALSANSKFGQDSAFLVKEKDVKKAEHLVGESERYRIVFLN